RRRRRRSRRMNTRLSTAAAFAVLLIASLAPADDFPAPYDTEPPSAQPMPADQAAAAFRVPPGFRVSVFAAEPDVRNPIAMAWGPEGAARGRGDLHLGRAAPQVRPGRARPRPDLRRSRRRRPVRPPHDLQRRAAAAHQPGARPRRGVAALPAAVALRPRPRWR